MLCSASAHGLGCLTYKSKFPLVYESRNQDYPVYISYISLYRKSIALKKAHVIVPLYSFITFTIALWAVCVTM